MKSRGSSGDCQTQAESFAAGVAAAAIQLEDLLVLSLGNPAWIRNPQQPIGFRILDANPDRTATLGITAGISQQLLEDHIQGVGIAFQSRRGSKRIVMMDIDRNGATFRDPRIFLQAPSGCGRGARANPDRNRLRSATGVPDPESG